MPHPKRQVLPILFCQIFVIFGKLEALLSCRLVSKGCLFLLNGFHPLAFRDPPTVWWETCIPLLESFLAIVRVEFPRLYFAFCSNFIAFADLSLLGRPLLGRSVSTFSLLIREIQYFTHPWLRLNLFASAGIRQPSLHGKITLLSLEF